MNDWGEPKAGTLRRRYTVNVTTAGTCTLDVRVASPVTDSE
jgi:hypothetical protein